MTGRTVLVVDDDPIILEVVRGLLTEAGYNVLLRDQALGTAELIAREQPDFVLLDVMMPGLSGDRLAAILKRHALTSRVRIILHSSKEHSDLQRIVRETGVLGAIEKTGDGGRFLRDFARLVEHASI